MDDIKKLKEELDTLSHRCYVLKDHVANLYSMSQTQMEIMDIDSNRIRRLEFMVMILLVTVIIESYLLILK